MIRSTLTRSTLTRNGLNIPTSALAGISGQMKLQYILFLVMNGPTIRNARPPVTKIRAIIHSMVVFTAGGS